jgi:hypothetical protein
MEQITLTLPASLISEIRWLSRREGRPEAEIIGEARNPIDSAPADPLRLLSTRSRARSAGA